MIERRFLRLRAGIVQRIETERLLLRPPEEADLDGWEALQADPEAARFLGGPLSRGQAWRNMATEAGSWRLKGYGMFSVIEKQTGQWIGRVGPHWPDGYPGLEVGWAVLPSHWGHGFATEAATAAIRAVFRTLDCSEVIHLIDPQNLRSVTLAERLGASRVGAEKLPDPYDRFTVDRWRSLRSGWT
ncbi:MAG: GNAT family N-acetyltransferase [Woeseiaceae bacterium]